MQFAPFSYLQQTISSQAVPAITGASGSIQFPAGNFSYVSFPSTSSYALGSGNFTVEMWVNLSNNSNAGLISNGPVSTDGGWMVEVAGGIMYWQTSGIANNIQSSIIPSASVWQHIAFVRNNNTLTYFLNGSSKASAGGLNKNYNLVSGSLVIGKSYNNTYTTGSLTNVRVTKGVAVYTANFTTSSIPLPVTQSANIYGNPSVAITGSSTSLLMNTTFDANYLKDNSTFNKIATNNNGVVSSPLSPF